jgi:hypothetical protein
MNRQSLDAWITGNYGEDHPDNRQHRKAAEADRADYLRREGEDQLRWWLARNPKEKTNAIV